MSAIGISAGQAAAVKATFDKVNGNPHQTVAGFYNKLFADNPELKANFPNFTGDLSKNSNVASFADKFMKELGSIIGALNDSAALTSLLENNASRHLGPRNINHEHYQKVLTALVGYLQSAHQGDMTPDAVSGWNAVAKAVVDKMKAMK